MRRNLLRMHPGPGIENKINISSLFSSKKKGSKGTFTFWQATELFCYYLSIEI